MLEVVMETITMPPRLGQSTVRFLGKMFWNLVVTGLSQRKAVFIISLRWEEISREILQKIGRGVTIIRGQGGYSRQEEQILYTIIPFRELSQLKRMIRLIDPNAFLVVSDTLEVMGSRIRNQPNWQDD
jgi:uncharacterized membrane-anchored protein YitT (DUF2179 family)